jgi:hypothetical protein
MWRPWPTVGGGCNAKNKQTIILTLFSYVSKDVGICVYFSKPNWINEKKILGKEWPRLTLLQIAIIRHQ